MLRALEHVFYVKYTIMQLILYNITTVINLVDLNVIK